MVVGGLNISTYPSVPEAWDVTVRTWVIAVVPPWFGAMLPRSKRCAIVILLGQVCQGKCRGRGHSNSSGYKREEVHYCCCQRSSKRENSGLKKLHLVAACFILDASDVSGAASKFGQGLNVCNVELEAIDRSWTIQWPPTGTVYRVPLVPFHASVWFSDVPLRARRSFKTLIAQALRARISSTLLIFSLACSSWTSGRTRIAISEPISYR